MFKLCFHKFKKKTADIQIQGLNSMKNLVLCTLLYAHKKINVVFFFNKCFYGVNSKSEVYFFRPPPEMDTGFEFCR